MELFVNATSPYARLVRIIGLEKGLAEAVILRWCDLGLNRPLSTAHAAKGRRSWIGGWGWDRNAMS